MEEIATTLAPTATAWMAQRSGSTYDAMAGVARSLLETADVPTTRVEEIFTVRELVEDLATYPGDDAWVYFALSKLGIPGAPRVIRQGTFVVGSEILPGTYRAENVDGCYWKTLDEAGEINDNNFVNSAPQVLMTVRPSDFAVNNECGLMVKVD